MENIKEALKAIVTITEKTDNALEDGRVSIAEGISIAMSALGLIKVVKTFGTLKTEFLNLTGEQKNELGKWFAGEFHLRNDKTEEIIEQVFNAFLQLSDSLDLIKKAA